MFARLTITGVPRIISSCKVFRNKRTLLHLVTLAENMIALASSIRSLSAHYQGTIHTTLFIPPSTTTTIVLVLVVTQRYSYPVFIHKVHKHTSTLAYSIIANPIMTFSSVSVFFLAYSISPPHPISVSLNKHYTFQVGILWMFTLLYESSKISNFRVKFTSHVS